MIFYHANSNAFIESDFPLKLIYVKFNNKLYILLDLTVRYDLCQN